MRRTSKQVFFGGSFPNIIYLFHKIFERKRPESLEVAIRRTHQKIQKPSKEIRFEKLKKRTNKLAKTKKKKRKQRT